MKLDFFVHCVKNLKLLFWLHFDTLVVRSRELSRVITYINTFIKYVTHFIESLNRKKLTLQGLFKI